MTSAERAVGVLGTGSYLPRGELTNAEIAARFDVTEDWIVRKTRIGSRRRAEPDEAVSDLAAAAGRRALDQAGLSADDVDHLIVSTSTGDHAVPPTSFLVQSRLGASRAACFDVNVACSGFVYALAIGWALAAVRPAARILVVAADAYSRFVDPEDRSTVVLLGDGAGAAVLGPVGRDRGVVDVELLGRGDHSDLLVIPGGGSRLPASPATVAGREHYLHMRGRDVSAFVRENVPETVGGLLERAGVSPLEVDHFVPHQANGVLLEELTDILGLKNAELHLTLGECGNVGSASVAITLDHAHRSGALADGDLVLLTGFGGGMSLGACLLRWSDPAVAS